MRPAGQPHDDGVVAQPGSIRSIVPGVWFRQGEIGGTGHCNNIVIEMSEYLIVVDANYPGGARAVLADIKTISSKPIKYVIDTHHHADHAYGNPVFTKAGAITIGHIGVIEEMNRYEPRFWQGVASYRKDVAELNLAGPEPPRQTYTESPYVISDCSRRVELHHFSFGHTRGDTFVYLPREKILCTGDAVVNGPHSDPKHSYIGNWANEIRAAQKLDVEHVLVGHGLPGGKELLEGQIQFFEALYKAVNDAIKKGQTLDQLVTRKDGRLDRNDDPASARTRPCLRAPWSRAALADRKVPHPGDGDLRGDNPGEAVRRNRRRQVERNSFFIVSD